MDVTAEKKAECPLDNNCLTPSIIYPAQVLTNLNDSKKFYIGLTDTYFKSVIETTQEVFEISIMKGARKSQNIFAVKKERNRIYHSMESSKSCQSLTKKSFL